jgi:Ca2+-binding RTX toxin-like protein
MLSVTVSQNTTTNTLTITGDSNANTINIYQQDYTPTDQISVEVVGQGLYGPFAVDADLTLLVVNAGAGADHVQFGNSTNGLLAPSYATPVTVPAQVHGDYDSDTLIGTDQPDTIWGDFGNDEIDGGGGNDTLYGGYGDGVETGNDTLTGGSGADSMYGEAGNDTFHAGGDSAADYLDGGSGSSDVATDRDIGTDTTVNIEILS